MVSVESDVPTLSYKNLARAFGQTIHFQGVLQEIKILALDCLH